MWHSNRSLTQLFLEINDKLPWGARSRGPEPTSEAARSKPLPDRKGFFPFLASSTQAGEEVWPCKPPRPAHLPHMAVGFCSQAVVVLCSSGHAAAVRERTTIAFCICPRLLGKDNCMWKHQILHSWFSHGAPRRLGVCVFAEAPSIFAFLR